MKQQHISFSYCLFNVGQQESFAHCSYPETRLTEALINQCGFPHSLLQKKENITNYVLLLKLSWQWYLMSSQILLANTCHKATSNFKGCGKYNVPRRTGNIWKRALKTYHKKSRHIPDHFSHSVKRSTVIFYEKEVTYKKCEPDLYQTSH